MHPLIAIPSIIAIVYRAHSRKSLTPFGLIIAAFSASIHALHPSPIPFTLLAVFFLAGTAATKVHHAVKSTLTLNATGSEGEGPRTHVQVLANSGCATALVLLHLFALSRGTETAPAFHSCLPGDLLLVGIIANYAAVAADTFSSELGILSPSAPRLITTFRTVPKGTNGGVTSAGLLAGLLGGLAIALPSMLLAPICPTNTWGLYERGLSGLAITVWGGLGSLLDSLLGALLQGSVVDRKSGKVIEGAGGVRVLVAPRSGEKGKEVEKSEAAGKGHHYHRELHGRDWLDNNQVNFLMALTMSVGAMVLLRIAPVRGVAFDLGVRGYGF